MSLSPKSRDSKGESVGSSPVASPRHDHSRHKLQRSPQSNSSSSGYNGSESSTEPMPTAYMDSMDSPQSQMGSCHTLSTYVPAASNQSPGSDVSQESTNIASMTVKEENPSSPQDDCNSMKRSGRGYPGIFLATLGSSLMPQGANPNMPLQDSWNIGSVPLQQNAILDLTTRSTSPQKDNMPGLANANNKFGLLRHSSAHGDHEDSPLAKRMRLLDSTSKRNGAFDWQPQSPTNATASSSSSCGDNTEVKRRRFLRTREALERSGLLNITMRTADLIKSNYVLNKQIEGLKSQTAELLKSIFDCPENEKASKSLNILQAISDPSCDSKQEPM